MKFILLLSRHADNQRPDVGVTQRQASPIIGLKNFNNWVKSVLIARFAHPALHGDENRDGKASGPVGGGRVLDLGCGKGGDLNKWQKAKVREYVGIGTWLRRRAWFMLHGLADSC